MNDRENHLRAARFETPEYIPISFSVNAACWNYYPQEALCDLMASHPMLFGDFERPTLPFVPQYGPGARADEPYTDSWGCLWETTQDGIVGVVTKHPLASWEDFDKFTPPDPDKQDNLISIDWDEVRGRFERAKAAGRRVRGMLRHGHLFMRICDLRGYENVVLDMADGERRLIELIEMVERFSLSIVRRYIDCGAEIVGYPEDLGMQVGPMLSPEHFHRYIRPSYERLMAPAREAGCLVHMHSDGDIRTLVADLIAGGVDILNLQDLVNGIDWIRDNLAGRVCLDLDIDRQEITPRGTPAEIDALIRREVETLGDKKGGLMLFYDLYPGVPLENAKAVMDALEKYSTYYS